MQSAPTHILLWAHYILPHSYKVKHDGKLYLAVPSGTDKGNFPTAYTSGLQNSLLLLLLLLLLPAVGICVCFIRSVTLNRQDTRSNIRAVLTYGILYLKKYITHGAYLLANVIMPLSLSLITIKRKA